ncbi:MAG: N-formylglutamate amidohydrolase [Bacteroidales bacterium]|nr:N-formylglutamate amidohydrolase [Bacteroidales bacterium]
MEKFNKIVLNIPHASLNCQSLAESGWKENANLINIMIKETDWHTDFIFTDTNNKSVVPFIFPYSRFIVDVERLENDPLESEGRGIVYKNIGSFARTTDDSYKQHLLEMRKDYLDRIADEIDSETIVIDCHSFNNELAKDVDICIGYNDDWSKPDKETIDNIVSIFESAGYRVAINRPYSNSITPKDSKDYKSVMIEVNKKLYLRNGIEINIDTRYAPRLTSTIKKVYNSLLQASHTVN